VKTGIPIRYDDPREVGPDRIVNAVAATERYGAPVIVVDFGTSTNFDVVSPEGEYVGGVLAPGIETSMEALFARAARLVKVDYTAPPSVIGKTTVAGLQSGLVYGFAGQVDGIMGRIRKELGADARGIATGGLADLVAPHSETIEAVDPFLTLDGLRLVWELNA
jgi:type III pantothenate kinase